MPSSFSTNLRFELQYTGENINLWGDKLNATFSRVDDSIAGYVAIALTGDYTLTSANTNASADEARRAHIKFTGTLSANATITIPSLSKSYKLWNATNKNLVISTGSGTTVTVDSGDILDCWSDGTNVKTTTFGGLALKDYIAATGSSSGAVPSPIGNELKFLYVDSGANVIWRQPATSDLSDYQTAVVAPAIAFAVAL